MFFLFFPSSSSSFMPCISNLCYRTEELQMKRKILSPNLHQKINIIKNKKGGRKAREKEGGGEHTSNCHRSTFSPVSLLVITITNFEIFPPVIHLFNCAIIRLIYAFTWSSTVTIYLAHRQHRSVLDLNDVFICFLFSNLVFFSS